MKESFQKKEPAIEIMEAVQVDVPGIEEVLYRTWLATYPNEEFGITIDDIEDRFKNRMSKEILEKRKKYIASHSINELALVAKKAGKVVGFCRVIRREDKNELLAIYVLPEHQGRGVGKLLWQRAKYFFDSGKNTIVQVAVYNEKAIRFYEKLGFCDTGKRRSDEKFRMKSGSIIPELEMVIKARKK